jgi:3-deoxy-D-manno-octulosonic-acid transferase
MIAPSHRAFEPALAFYRMATSMLGPFAPALLNWRRRRGKEDPLRMAERMGHASLARPAGPLVWLHGASVGEGVALLPLVERLVARGLNVLVTSGTVTSAAILADRLPAGALHQYLPLDISGFMARFLDHWRPDLALVAESEIWPNMLRMAHERGVPLALVNARLSPRSFARWGKAPKVIGSLLSRIDLCLAQTRDDALRLQQLGAQSVEVSGNLKYDVPAPPYVQSELAQMTAEVGARPVWFAASTHPGEEEIILTVHQRLKERFPDLLTILAPRHARRGPQIAQVAASFGLPAALRSVGDRITPTTQFYIADTMGEMGLFYRLTSVVLVGKSLGGARGGQNPIEPAKLGATVLHGPNVSNFAEVFKDLAAAQGAVEVADAAALEAALRLYFSDPALLRRSGRATQEAVERFGGATTRIMQALEPYLAQMQAGRP